MQITDVRIKLAENRGNTKAWVTITIDGMFAVKGLKVIETDKGTFVGMPSRKIKDVFSDIAHPISAEGRAIVQEAILAEYEKIKGEQISN